MALGIVLAPYGKIPGSFPSPIGNAYGGSAGYVTDDPQYVTRGEAGYYHDTPLGSPALGFLARWRARRQLRGLGAIPTDFEMGRMYGTHTPVTSGWIPTKDGRAVQPPPWIPSRPQGLGEAAPATVEDVVAHMNAHNDRVFALSLVSTAAVTVSAMITIFRTLRLIKRGGGD